MMKSPSPRKYSAATRLALAAVAASVATASADQLIVNGDFELGLSSWVPNPAYPGFNPVADGHLSVATPDFSSNWVVRQNLNVPSPAGAELTFSIDLKAQWVGFGTATSLTIEYVDDLDDLHQVTGLVVDASAVSTGAFTEHSATFTVPANARKLTGLLIDYPESAPNVEADNISVDGPGLTPGSLPTITSISNSGVPYGTTVTIDGQNFGPAPDTLTVGGSSSGIDIQSWSDTQITFNVADPAQSGRVVVNRDGSSSHEGIHLRITSPNFTLRAIDDPVGHFPGSNTSTVIRGSQRRILAACNFENGFAPPAGVTLSVPGDPTGSATFTPPIITGTGGSLLTLDTSTLPPDTYTLTVRASADGSADREATFTFTVATVDSLDLQSFGIPVPGPTFDVTKQGSFFLAGTPNDAAGNPLPPDTVQITSSNPAAVRVFTVTNFFSGDYTELFAVGDGTSTLTYTFPDGFNRTIDVNVSLPATPRINSIGLSPQTVSNAGTETVTLTASGTENLGLSWSGDISLVDHDTNWFDSNRSVVSTFKIDPLQRPGNFLWRATTGGFGGTTAALPAVLTVVNDPLKGCLTGEVFKVAPDDFPDTSGEIELYDASGDGSTPVRSLFINTMNRATFAIPAIPPGTYKLRFNNASQAVASAWYPNAPDFASAATLAVESGTYLTDLYLFLPAAPFAITMQPVGKVLSPGDSTSIDVTASGAGLSYQWFQNGTPLPGETFQSLFIPSASLADTGVYHVAVTNAIGTLTSNPTRIDVVTPGFLAWTTDRLPPGGLDDPLVAGYTANPSGGPSNLLMHYALGQDPLAPAADPVTSVNNPSGNPTLGVILPNPNPPDVLYEVWSSSRPDHTTGGVIATKQGTGPWSGTATVTTVPAPGGGLAVAVEDATPPGGTPRFLWLTVSPR